MFLMPIMITELITVNGMSAMRAAQRRVQCEYTTEACEIVAVKFDVLRPV